MSLAFNHSNSQFAVGLGLGDGSTVVPSVAHFQRNFRLGRLEHRDDIHGGDLFRQNPIDGNHLVADFEVGIRKQTARGNARDDDVALHLLDGDAHFGIGRVFDGYDFVRHGG